MRMFKLLRKARHYLIVRSVYPEVIARVRVSQDNKQGHLSQTIDSHIIDNLQTKQISF